MDVRALTERVAPEELQAGHDTSAYHNDDVESVLNNEVQVHDEHVDDVAQSMHAHHHSELVLLLIHQLHHRLKSITENESGR